jgi:type II secretory pathway component PulF
MVADYYHRTGLLWTRLKGVLVYPAIVLFGAMLLSLFVAWIYLPLAEATGISEAMIDLLEGRPSAGFESALWIAGLFLPAILITLTALTVISVVCIRPLRSWLGWRFPGFREARIAQVAAALNLMLSGGCSIREAVGWLRELERGTPVGEDLDRWEIVLQQGGTRAEQLRPVSRLMPPLFFWVLAGDGEVWAGGTRRASELYQGRAAYYAELLLNAALPVSILALGLMIMGQLVSLVRLVLGSGLGDLLLLTCAADFRNG